MVKRDGIEKQYYEDGSKKGEISYKDDKLNGRVITYWENGTIKRNDLYLAGNLMEGKITNDKGRKVKYYNYEVSAEFKGGTQEMMMFIQENVHYPAAAKEAGIAGKVFVKFVVETNGSITNVEVIKGVDKELDDEAIKVVRSMPKWNPA